MGSSLKIVAGARKFVPGTKLCIQPGINPHAHKSKESQRKKPRFQPPLLPGLLEGLVIDYLVRVLRIEH
uniref:Uncharacterized protein n=1 Tax=Vitis vinifera TaxID=29760 RepID=F6HTN3_VITVI